MSVRPVAMLPALEEEVAARIALRRIVEQACERGDAVLAAILNPAIAEIDGRIERADRKLERDSPSRLGPPVARYVTIRGRRRRLSLEDDFWHALDHLAERGMMTLGELCERAVECEGGRSIISALRVYVLRCYAPELRDRVTRAQWHRRSA